jgi:hypothetical protein
MSPLAKANDAAAPAEHPARHAPLRVLARRHYVLAGLGVTVLTSAVLLFTLLTASPGDPTGDHETPRVQASTRAPERHKAEQLLGRGEYHAALAEATAALASQGGLSPGDRLAWTQLQREAALLADLSAESLAEILRHGAGLPEAEWAATFRRRYHGQAVLLDITVVRAQAGGYRHTWRVLLNVEEPRLELNGLRLLDRLPLEEPQRLLVGARLASARREPPGRWVVNLEADSGVLLTDPGAAALCCPALSTPEARELLRRQRTWLGGDAGPQASDQAAVPK